MLDYLEYNSILYKEITKYLKLKNERVSKDLFLCILSSCRMVYTGSSVTHACSLAGMGAGGEHFEGRYVSKYVRPIMKIAKPILEEEEKKKLNKNLVDVIEVD